MKRLAQPPAWAGLWLAFLLMASQFLGQFHALEHGLELSHLGREGLPGAHLVAQGAHASETLVNASPRSLSQPFDDHAAGSPDCKVWDSLLCGSGLSSATATPCVQEPARHLPIAAKANPCPSWPLAQLPRGPPTFL